ncbi:MAG: Fe-S protein assembly chaperone HscA [Holosporales bacterium]
MFLQLVEPGTTPDPHSQQDEIAVGIDLGTTHSLVAVADEAGARVLSGSNGQTLMPSVVAYLEETYVGGDALMRLQDSPEQVVISIKRLMGKGSQAGQLTTVKVADQSLTPQQVSAEILKALKARAEAALGKPVHRAVITIPAHFDDVARQATREAASLAGLEVLRLLSEPTAAAVAYGLDHGAEGLYAVYDLGGGTFDISLLRLTKGVFQVLATGGHTALGGDDFDHLIVNHCLHQLGISEKLEPAQLRQALAAARACREHLTLNENSDWIWKSREKTHKITLSRAQFETLAQPLVQKTLHACARSLKDAEVLPQDIQGVLLVGGATRMPVIRRAVADFFDQAPLTDLHPDEVVALGAARQAAALTQAHGSLLLDVTPLSLGIETMGGMVERLINRNTVLPAVAQQDFTTSQDGQTAILIHVLQGERELAHGCRSLARFELRGLPPLPAGRARVRVSFKLDADGLLSVSAQDLMSGTTQEVAVKPSYGLGPDDLADMLRDAFEHAESDHVARYGEQKPLEGQESPSRE